MGASQGAAGADAGRPAPPPGEARLSRPPVSRLVDAVFGGLKIAMVAFLALMVVLVFGNVVLRYGFNRGITISEEMSRMLFVWLTFISAIVAMRERAHLGMDTLVRRLPPAGKKVCYVASHALILVACLLFLQGSWEQTLISYRVGAIAPVTGMSMTLFYGTGVLFSVCAVALTSVELVRLMAGRLRDDELVSVREALEVAPDSAASGGDGEARRDATTGGSDPGTDHRR